MDTDQIIKQAQDLRNRIQIYAEEDRDRPGAVEDAAQAQVCEFLRQYAGPKNAFLKQAEAALGSGKFLVGTLSAILASNVFPTHY